LFSFSILMKMEPLLLDDSKETMMMEGRRDFLKRATLVTTGLMVGAPALSLAQDVERPGLAAATFREQLLKCLGGPWPEGCELRPKVEQTVQKDGYRLEKVSYEVEPNDRVPAYLLVPDGVSKASPAPAVAVWHQHNGEYHLGKSEPAGPAGNPMHHTGVALVKLGYVVLCPDALCFEERQDPEKKLKGGNYKRFESCAWSSRAGPWPGRTSSTCGGRLITW
jgi:hypothetical protein